MIFSSWIPIQKELRILSKGAHSADWRKAYLRTLLQYKQLHGLMDVGFDVALYSDAQ